MPTTKRYLIPLLVLYLAASLIYNLSFPIMEGSDEPFHYGYIEQLRRGQGFPDPTQAPDNLAEYESSQAPLYYLTAAGVLRLLPGLPEWNGELRINRWFGGQPVAYPDNKNIFLHDLDSPSERFQGIALGVRLARLVSASYGLLTVLATYWLAREITGGVAWLPAVAAAMVAFNPQFIQISAVVENDTSASAFVGLTLWQLARIVQRRPPGLGEYALAGLFTGLAIIAKSSALVVLPLAGLGLGLAWWSGGRGSQEGKRIKHVTLTWLGRVSVLYATAALIGGWWYLRNWLLYADPLRYSAYDHYPWTYPHLRTVQELLPDAPRSLLSYWADLGYSGDIRPSPMFYAGAWLIVLLAIGGLVRWALGRRSECGLNGWPPLLLVASAGVLVIAMYIRLQQTFSFAWGRHLLPGASAFGTLIAIGLYHLWPRRGRIIRPGSNWFPSAVCLLHTWAILAPGLLAPALC